MTNTAQFSNPEHTSIDAVIGGKAVGVPVDAANRHYRLLVESNTVIIDYAASAVTADDVRAEAGRRILAVYGWAQQNNMLAEAISLSEIGASDRNDAQNARVVVLNDAWAWVAAVRAASNVMEASPPDNYRDDSHWPA